MDQQLFRQKSIDRISSPEQLHDYMRVTSPRLWMILIAILVLLAGFLVFASTANMENTMTLKVQVSTIQPDGKTITEPATMVVCELPASEIEVVKPGMKVRLGDETGQVGFLYTSGENLSVLFDMDKPVLSMPDGEYDATLVLESRTPISFLLN